MRCAVGDLCFVIRDEAFPDNVGRLVTIVGHLDLGKFVLVDGSEAMPHDWDCKPESSIYAGMEYAPQLTTENVAFGDSELFPIRPGDGLDQMLRIAGLPKESVLRVLKGTEV